ncbi:MAG: AAA family ATPase [Lacipirellulaceae bacterium]
MLTRLQVRNFKRFADIDVELGDNVVFVGPNNSGKTAALQALALWDIGLRHWNTKKQGRPPTKARPGVLINRQALAAIPVPAANLLWTGKSVRRSAPKPDGKPGTANVRIEIVVDGVTAGTQWTCGLEFDYANDESFTVRPAREASSKSVKVSEAQFTTVPAEAAVVRVAFLPPMSGLAEREFVKQPGEIAYLIGQGQTAEVLRNQCSTLARDNPHAWSSVVESIERLFGVKLINPSHLVERAEITMEYEESGVRLDLTSAGRGLQQTLLLLTHLQLNPGAVLVLDEPDAHLETLRQREVFAAVTEVARAQGSQVIAASHSEEVLNLAADTGHVVAFVGKPHMMNGQKDQVRKALATIGWHDYFKAKVTGWVLYLEGSTDLEILRAFAESLGHPAGKHLKRPFFVPVDGNHPPKAREHFYGLREAKPDLCGLALYDRLDKHLSDSGVLSEISWRRREIENYLCSEESLLAYARAPLDWRFPLEAESSATAMRSAIEEVRKSVRTLRDTDIWSPDVKASDEVLVPIFRLYKESRREPEKEFLRKSDFHRLAAYVSKASIDPEVVEKLDAIAHVAESAKPGQEA